VAQETKGETTMSDLKEIVRPFYTQCLTVNAETNVAEKMGQILADDFQSKGSADVKSKAQLIGQIQFFWKLVPNLKWEIQEMIQEGNQVVVRSLASGTPKGNFMGVEADGTKAFKTMTIDIHTVKNGQVVEVHHLEDWATAIKQLQG
jgi:predicted ester cyclase